MPYREPYIGYSNKYYSSADIRIFFGSIWFDDVVFLEYSVAQDKQPMYGYSSSLMDAVARGKVLVTGSLAINFSRTPYLQVLIDYVTGNKRLSELPDSSLLDVSIADERTASAISYYRYAHGSLAYPVGFIDGTAEADKFNALSDEINKLITEKQNLIFADPLICYPDHPNYSKLSEIENKINDLIAQQHRVTAFNTSDRIREANVFGAPEFLDSRITPFGGFYVTKDGRRAPFAIQKNLATALQRLDPANNPRFITQLREKNLDELLSLLEQRLMGGPDANKARIKRIDEHDIVIDQYFERYIAENTFDIIITYGDVNTPGAPSTVKVINDVHFIGESQTISIDSMPVLQRFNFIARNIDERPLPAILDMSGEVYDHDKEVKLDERNAISLGDQRYKDVEWLYGHLENNPYSYNHYQDFRPNVVKVDVPPPPPPTEERREESPLISLTPLVHTCSCAGDGIGLIKSGVIATLVGVRPSPKTGDNDTPSSSPEQGKLDDEDKKDHYDPRNDHRLIPCTYEVYIKHSGDRISIDDSNIGDIVTEAIKIGSQGTDQPQGYSYLFDTLESVSDFSINSIPYSSIFLYGHSYTLGTTIPLRNCSTSYKECLRNVLRSIYDISVVDGLFGFLDSYFSGTDCSDGKYLFTVLYVLAKYGNSLPSDVSADVSSVLSLYSDGRLLSDVMSDPNNHVGDSYIIDLRCFSRMCMLINTIQDEYRIISTDTISVCQDSTFILSKPPVSVTDYGDSSCLVYHSKNVRDHLSHPFSSGRYDVSKSELVATFTHNVKISDLCDNHIYVGNEIHDVNLEPGDIVYVRVVPDSSYNQQITVDVSSCPYLCKKTDGGERNGKKPECLCTNIKIEEFDCSTITPTPPPQFNVDEYLRIKSMSQEDVRRYYLNWLSHFTDGDCVLIRMARMLFNDRNTDTDLYHNFSFRFLYHVARRGLLNVLTGTGDVNERYFRLGTFILVAAMVEHSYWCVKAGMRIKLCWCKDSVHPHFVSKLASLNDDLSKLLLSWINSLMLNKAYNNAYGYINLTGEFLFRVLPIWFPISDTQVRRFTSLYVREFRLFWNNIGTTNLFIPPFSIFDSNGGSNFTVNNYILYMHSPLVWLPPTISYLRWQSTSDEMARIGSLDEDSKQNWLTWYLSILIPNVVATKRNGNRMDWEAVGRWVTVNGYMANLKNIEKCFYGTDDEINIIVDRIAGALECVLSDELARQFKEYSKSHKSDYVNWYKKFMKFPLP